MLCWFSLDLFSLWFILFIQVLFGKPDQGDLLLSSSNKYKMTSRALRKLKRQELPPEETLDSSEDEQPNQKKFNAFELLQPLDHLQEQHSDEDDNPESVDAIEPATTHKLTQTSKSKKKRSKASKNTQKEPTSLVEIDSILKELDSISDSLPMQQEMSETLKSKNSRLDLLSIDSRYLDPDAELKRMFGSLVVQDAGRKKRFTRTAKRQILASFKDTWPRMTKLGLNMDVLKTEGGAR